MLHWVAQSCIDNVVYMSKCWATVTFGWVKTKRMAALHLTYSGTLKHKELTNHCHFNTSWYQNKFIKSLSVDIMCLFQFQECFFKHFSSLVRNISKDPIWDISDLFREQHDSFASGLHKTRYIQLLKVVKDLQPENMFEDFKATFYLFLGWRLRSGVCQVK